jgi:two-component system OmpR family sensor kinase
MELGRTEPADHHSAASRPSIRPPPGPRARDARGVASFAEDLIADRDDVALQEAFVGVLSHELRTPVTAIYGGTQLLLNDQMSPTARAQVVADIAAEAEQLHRLVEDLLAIARLERGISDAGSEPVLLQRLARRAVEAEQRRWPGSQVRVETKQDLPAIRGDEGYVTQILRNLISNAVKHNPPNEAVTVSLRADPDDTVTASVLDRGSGFPPGTGPDAFRLFYRSPAIAARMPGTGIGLYVARALVEAQGGRIWLRNRIDGGAEVGFSLPVFEPDGAE